MSSGLERGIWPASAQLDAHGELQIAGVAASALAAEFGTPLFVLDEDLVRERAVRIRTAFERAAAGIGTTASVYYAGKAFLSTAFARWMSQSGLGVDVASGGEMAIAVAGGVPAARLGVHGNNKSDAEIDEAVRLGVGSIVIDSAEEIDRVSAAAARHGVRQRVRLRVNSGVHAHTHEYLSTAHDDQKFGVPLADAAELCLAIQAQPHLEFLGVHCHIGSQIFEPAAFVESAVRLLALYAEPGVSAPELNLGGGFGINYLPEDDAPEIEAVAEAICQGVAARCAELGISVPKLCFEPGRWIVGPAGITLYSVGTVKSVPLEAGASRLYVAVDGGMSDNLRPALYGARYSVRLANRASAAPAVLSRVAGKHCETGDVLIDSADLPGDVDRGDLLAVAATGAYCSSLSSNYNALGRPAVVGVHAQTARILLRRETVTDLLARDAGPGE